MGYKKKVSTSMEEDFNVLGLGNIEYLAGIEVEENSSDELSEDKDSDEITSEEDVNSEVDPLDDEFVNVELFERIKNLPFDKMEDDHFDELIEALREKSIPEDDEELAQLAEEVIELIFEEKKKKGKKKYVIKGGKKKAIFMKTGAEKIKSQKMARKYRRKKKAKIALTRKKRVRKPSAMMRRTARYHKAHGESSGFADEIRASLSESVDDYQNLSDREDIIEHFGNIFELIENQIDDEEVIDIMVELYGSILDRYDNNELSESVMKDEEFVEVLKPALIVLKKCYEHLESEEVCVEEEDDDDEDLVGNLKALATGV